MTDKKDKLLAIITVLRLEVQALKWVIYCQKLDILGLKGLLRQLKKENNID